MITCRLLRGCGKVAGRGVRIRSRSRKKKLKRENCFDVNGAKEDDFGVREVCDGVLLLRSPIYLQKKLRHKAGNLIFKEEKKRKKK